MGRVMNQIRRGVVEASPHLDTAGPADIVSFSTDMASPAKALIVGMEPVQDLHGYDAPWPAGGGKNIVNESTGEWTSVYGGISSSFQSGVWTIINSSAAQTRSANMPVGTLSAGTYYLSATAGTMIVRVNLKRTLDDVTIGYFQIGDANPTAITISEDTECYLNVTTTQGTNSITHLMLSPENTTYSPYENLCPITGRTGLTVERTGKNLLNPAERQNIGTSNIHFYFTNGLLLKAGQAYTFSVSTAAAQLTFLAMDGTNLAVAYSTTKKTYTPSEDVLVKFDAYFSGQYPAPSGGLSEVNCQLDLGSTASDYSAYSGATYPVTWQTEAGTVYGGTVDLVSGVLTVTHGMVDLGATGSDEWSYIANDGEPYFRLYLSGKKPGLGMICSNYQVSDTTGTRYLADKRIGAGAVDTRVYLRDTAYTTLESFVTAIDGVQLVYELETPQTYQLTPQQIQMLKGANVLWSNSDSVTVKFWTHI